MFRHTSKNTFFMVLTTLLIVLLLAGSALAAQTSAIAPNKVMADWLANLEEDYPQTPIAIPVFEYMHLENIQENSQAAEIIVLIEDDYFVDDKYIEENQAQNYFVIEDEISTFSIMSIAAESFTAESLTLQPGAKASSMNFAWYSDRAEDATSLVQIAPIASVIDNVFPADAIVVEGTVGEASAGKSWHKVSVSGLASNTVYAYCVSNDKNIFSEIYEFKTGASDKFTFAVVGDPQLTVGDQDSTSFYRPGGNIGTTKQGWQDTLHALAARNIDFIASVGDLVDQTSNGNEAEYANLFAPAQMRSLPISAAIGNHDRHYLFNYHYNIPNEQVFAPIVNSGNETNPQYQTMEVAANYYYMYNNALFVVLNTSGYPQNKEVAAQYVALFEQTLTAAVAAHAGEYEWLFVQHHKSTASVADHLADTDIQYYVEAGFEKLMDKYQVDFVLAGHDHVYARSYPMLNGVPDKLGASGIYDVTLIRGGDGASSAINPQGTVYFTSTTGSGLKYYELFNAAGNLYVKNNVLYPYLTGGLFGSAAYAGANINNTAAGSPSKEIGVLPLSNAKFLQNKTPGYILVTVENNEVRFAYYDLSDEYKDTPFDTYVVTKTPTYDFNVYLQTKYDNYSEGEKILVDVMLQGDINYTQVATEIAFDPELLQYNSYTYLNGWVASVTKAAPDKVAIHSMPSMNMVIGASCVDDVKIATLQFTVKNGLSSPSLDSELDFASLTVAPAGSVKDWTTAPGQALTISLEKLAEILAPPATNVNAKTFNSNIVGCPTVITKMDSIRDLKAVIADGITTTAMVEYTNLNNTSKMLQAVANNNLAMFIINTVDEAQELGTYLNQTANTQAGYTDTHVASTNTEALKVLRNIAKRVRASWIVDFEITMDNYPQVVYTTNAGWAMNIIVSAENITKPVVEQLQRRMISVWVESNGSSIGNLDAINMGANGIITENAAKLQADAAIYTTRTLARRPYYAAHRGLSSAAPENTLPAYELAIAAGADLVECDLYLTKDGEVILLHDDYFARTTDIQANFNTLFSAEERAAFTAAGCTSANMRPQDLTLEQIKRLNAAAWSDNTFAPGANRSGWALKGYDFVEIPTLREVMELLAKTDVILDCELKDTRVAHVTPAYEVVGQVGQAVGKDMYNQIIFISFQDAELTYMAENHPQASTGRLTAASANARDILRAVLPLNCSGYNPGSTGLNQTLVPQVSARALTAWCYTIDAVATARNHIDWGSWGITTNYCNRASTAVMSILAEKSTYQTAPGEAAVINSISLDYLKNETNLPVSVVVIEGADNIVSIEGNRVTVLPSTSATIMLKAQSIAGEFSNSYTLYSQPVTIMGGSL